MTLTNTTLPNAAATPTHPTDGASLSSASQADRTRTQRRSRRALSLIEVVCVIVIIGIAGAIAVPRYVNSVTAYRVEAASKRIISDLAMVAQRARSEHRSITVSFSEVSESYKIDGIQSLDRRSTDYGVDLSADPYQINLSDIDFDKTAVVTFDEYGRPDNAGQLTISAGSHKMVVAVDGSSGRAYIK